MIFAPTSATTDQLHQIRGTQAAWRNAIAIGVKHPEVRVAADRIAVEAATDLRHMWKAAA